MSDATQVMQDSQPAEKSTVEKTSNLHVVESRALISPRRLKEALPSTAAHDATVLNGREVVTRILSGEDQRLLVVVGPCSIHDPKAALEYAERLNRLRVELEDRMFIIMRVYFEKPRTTVGWKGLISDPHLDDSYDIEEGLKIARKLLLDINGMGLPTATEMLDPITPQYIADLVSWTAIGARTTESQTHRQMASGLSMPVGFKNGTDGGLQIALDAMQSARSEHHFLGIDQEGVTSVIRTSGNPDGHVVLRGGRGTTNYGEQSIADAEEKLSQSDLRPVMMVDCSHANSEKDHARQENVWRDVIAQRAAGTKSLIGMMVESHLHEGNQKMTGQLADLNYGVSITDACVNWETTERMLTEAHQTLGIAPATVNDPK
jgi:3-deoxy-7-phosphoheptulonate synthase